MDVFFKSCLRGRWKTAYQTDTGDLKQGQEISLAMISAEHMVPPDVCDQGYHSLDYQSVVNPQRHNRLNRAKHAAQAKRNSPEQ